ncbi:MAG: hypothetical protein JWM61_671 [Micrococcaceae bacterium]|jgi:hypothetical protein|nr:hypothetical protein [Micrococcaceae bacterium]
MRPRRGEADRFWEKVVKGPRPQGCWIWTGAVADDGYGRFWVTRDGEQRALRPQRYAYEHLTGKTLHSGIVLMHVRDVPLCVHASAGGDTTCCPAPKHRTCWTGPGRVGTPTRQPFDGEAWAAPSSAPSPLSCVLPS